MSKSKKPKTSKSGVIPAAQQLPEKCVQELVSASEWWSALVGDYYRCAAQGKILIPKMQESIKNLQDPDFILTEVALKSFLEDVAAFRKALRKGSSDEFEFQLFKVVKAQVEGIVALKTVREVKQKGWDGLLPGLETALGLLSAQMNAAALKETLQTWHSDLKGQFAQEAFKVQLDQAFQKNAVDWPALTKAFTAVQGCDLSELRAQWSEIFLLMFTDIHKQVGLGSPSPITKNHSFI